MSALFPFTPNYLDIDGHRMHYVDEGEGDVVLMLHGNPSWSFLYRDLIGELKRDHRAVAPDHIGCGRSDKPDDGAYDYTLASRVSDLSRLVEELDVHDITLVVHDWGGMIAWYVAMLRPDVVDRLIVLNLPHPKGLSRELANNPEQEQNSAYARNFQAEGSHESLGAAGLAFWVRDEAARSHSV